MNENPTTAKEKYDLAYHYYLGGNKNRSNHWFVQAFNQAWKDAEQGDAEAMYLVYSIYKRTGGYGVYDISWDGIKARDWLFKSAKLGYAPAQYDIGYAYKCGWEYVGLYLLGDKNETEANYWLTKAAEQGHVEAQYLLGSNNWLTKAAEQGHIEAQYSLGMNYIRGKDLVEEGSHWLTKAAERGHHKAQVELARFYSKIDKAKSQYWKDKAKQTEKSGCYIATCVYGSYDCPEVWTLRCFRDNELSNSWLGRCFIRIYYAVSPKIVELFGNKKWFSKLWKPIIDKIVLKLQKENSL